MFYIIKQGLKIQLSERKWILFHMVFPIFLMVLIGTILSSTFEDSINIEKINISYLDNGTEKSKYVFDALKKSNDDIQLEFSKVKDIEEGKDKVRKKREVFVYLDNNKIKVYYSDKSIRGSLVLSTLESISDGYGVVTEMYNVNPEKATEILERNDFYEDIRVETVNADKAPNAYQYYGVVELTMMTIYVALFPIGVMAYDKRKGMRDRIKLAGISDFTYYFGRIISSWMVSIINLIPGFLFSIFVLNTNWGEKPQITFIYVSALSLMIATLGVVVGYIIKERDKAAMVLQGIIFPIMSFLGGAYIIFPEDLNVLFNIATYISPLRWLNKGVFQLAYSGDWTFLNRSLAINLSVTSILIMMLAIMIKREEKLV